MPGHILIVDDHPMVRGALRDVVSVLTPDTPILTAGTLAESMEQLEGEPRIEFITLDLRLPDTHGLTGVIDLHARYPKKKLLVTSAHDDPDLVRLTLLLGAAGFLSKSCSTDVIKSAIADFIRPRHRDDDTDGADKRMFADGYFLPPKDLEALTPQQSRVLRHLCEGHMNKIIAFEMGVSETTVKAHVSEILRKFGMRTRTLAILRVINPF